MKSKKSERGYMAALFGFLFIAFLNGTLVGKLEGKIFPVVSDFKYSVVKSENGISTINGSFEKNRNCSLESFKWFVSDERYGDIFAEVGVSFKNKYIIRKIGHQEFSGWEINSNGISLKNSKIVMDHKCYFWWATETTIELK